MNSLTKMYVEENEMLKEANEQAKDQIEKLQSYIKNNDKYKILYQRTKETLLVNEDKEIKSSIILEYMTRIEEGLEWHQH